MAASGARQGQVRLRAYPDHLLNFYVQYSSTGEREMIIEIPDASVPPFDLPAFRNIGIAKLGIAGGLRISMVLLEPDLARNFAVMCYDLAERSKGQATVAGAVSVLLRVLESWAELFKRRADDGLTKEETLGLIGELLVLEDLMNDGRTSPEVIVRGWRGPDGDARDIGFNGARIEVKTQRSTSATALRISSLEQLNDRGDKVFIVVRRVSPSDEGRSLAELVESVTRRMTAAPLAALEFDRKIALSGLDSGSPLSQERYAADERLVYTVSSDFPRLITANVPIGVIAAQYELGGPALEAFRSAWDDLEESVHG
ncbi:MAG: PD-(D/E)XK motif protein [Verrucomicrobiaceae bacterium]|nr:MAG: PD-(D/E)XK motif protein [Verrucomicrobiaceae bacterium]